MKFIALALGWLVLAVPASGQSLKWAQRDADSYTRYELLDPATHGFRIYYDVSAVSPGAPFYFNGLRAGSEHEVHSVTDLMTGKPLEWRIVKGAEAAELGVTNLRAEGEYLQVKLAKPVPDEGERRLRIDKTYRDPESFRAEGDRIIFTRSLGIKRNAVVLPRGYEVVSCNYPSQVALEKDGRIRLSFLNVGPASVPYRIEARALPQPLPPAAPVTSNRALNPPSTSRVVEGSNSARLGFSFSERAFQDREIVYFLNPPESHSFRLYHDYTESREGSDRYLNIVRPGSKASNPSARLLDTGETLLVETLRGEAIREKGIEIPNLTPQTEVVVIWFAAVKKGESKRIRIEETYTDPNRYLLHGRELIWDRAFGRPVNDVLLPAGWVLTSSSVPATIRLDADRLRLRFTNDRPGNIEVHLKAQRRPR